MKIFNAMTLAQLQTFKHALNVLQEAGVTNISTAGVVIDQEINNKLLEYEKLRDGTAAQRTVACPKCDKTMRYCNTMQAWFCGCGYSRLEVGP